MLKLDHAYIVHEGFVATICIYFLKLEINTQLAACCERHFKLVCWNQWEIVSRWCLKPSKFPPSVYFLDFFFLTSFFQIWSVSMLIFLSLPSNWLSPCHACWRRWTENSNGARLWACSNGWFKEGGILCQIFGKYHLQNQSTICS